MVQKSHRQDFVRQLVRIAIFIAFVIGIEFYYGWLDLLVPWKNQSPAQLCLAVALVFSSYWVRSMRVYDYFRDQIQGSFLLCFKLTLQHNLLNNLLPMRTGEISFPVLMSRYFQISMLRSVPALLWFRMLDLHTVGALAVLIANPFPRHMLLAILVLVAWMTLPALAFWGSHRLMLVLEARAQNRAGLFLLKVIRGMPQESITFGRTWVWTLSTWAVKLGVFAWVLQLFVDIPWSGAFLGAILGDLTSVLPFHNIGGAGTYEAGVVAGLVPFGASASSALAAAINLHLFLLAATLFGGALSLLLKGETTEGRRVVL
ncbi:MAG: lysylphosphatidylglycerol synthase domain-containing protein [Candidatus Binatia bacterium]